MLKRIFFHGFCAGLLAAVAGIIYDRIHFFATETNFSRLINIGSVLGITMLSSMLAAIGYWLCRKWFKKKADIVFNFAFAILSFASIVLPISISLPLDIQNPELFPGLAVPMHFFPVLAWFTLDPLFRVQEEPEKEKFIDRR